MTRYKIKMPIIYFLFPMGKFIFSKRDERQTFSIKHLKKMENVIFILNLFPPPTSRFC